MAGHSKWAQIKRKKGALDVKKGATLAKMAKHIMVAVRTGGGGDPRHNFQLRTAIDKAKESGVPKANIERAIEKAMGAGSESELQELTYEAYLPGGIAVMIFTATDNNNRTSQDLRAILGKAGGELGSQGCVGYLFNKRGELLINRSDVADEESLMEAAIEAGASDIETDFSEEQICICVAPENLLDLNKTLASKFKIQEARINRVPLSTIELKSQEAISILKALNALDDHDDVLDVISNVAISED